MSDPVIDALRRGDAPAAVASARAAMDARPEDPDTHHLLGVALLLAGEPAEAQECFDRAIAMAPERPLYHTSRSALALAQGDLEAASSGLDSAVALNPNRLPVYLAQAQIAMARGDLDEAEQRISRALRINNDHPRALLALGNLCVARRDADGALKAYTQAARLAPRDAAVQVCLGVTYLHRGNLDFAEQALRNALALDPQLHAARRTLVQALLRLGRAPDAATEVQALVERNPDSGASWALLGDVQALAGEQDPALRATAQASLLRALELAPDHVPALHALVALWLREDKRQHACDFLDARLAQDPRFDPGWQVRVSLAQDDPRAASEVVRRWVAARPDSAAASAMLAQVLEAEGDLERAEQVADATLERDPTRIAAQLVLVRAQIRHSPQLALERCLGLANALLDPQWRAQMLGWAGHAAHAAGHPTEAVQYWLQAQATANRGATLPELPAAGEYQQALKQRLAALPAAAADASGPAPVLLLGAPGSSVDRLASLLRGQSGVLLLDDRFTAQSRRDGFAQPQFARWMAADNGAVAALADSWRQGLGQAVQDDGRVLVEWLPLWDARFLSGLAAALPGTRFLMAMRDPRDMLLNWIACGSPQHWPVRDPLHAAQWLAGALHHLHAIVASERFAVEVVDLARLQAQPARVLPAIGALLGTAEPPDPAEWQRGLAAPGRWPDALPEASWQAYDDVLAAPFAALEPMVRAFGFAPGPA